MGVVLLQTAKDTDCILYFSIRKINYHKFEIPINCVKLAEKCSWLQCAALLPKPSDWPNSEIWKLTGSIPFHMV
jgi:hypothetical protein